VLNGYSEHTHTLPTKEKETKMPMMLICTTLSQVPIHSKIAEHLNQRRNNNTSIEN
jgi:hypothetical protein